MSLAKLLTFYFLIFKLILIKHQEHWLYLFHEMTCKSHISLKYSLYHTDTLDSASPQREIMSGVLF